MPPVQRNHTETKTQLLLNAPVARFLWREWGRLRRNDHRKRHDQTVFAYAARDKATNVTLR